MIDRKWQCPLFIMSVGIVPLLIGGFLLTDIEPGESTVGFVIVDGQVFVTSIFAGLTFISIIPLASATLYFMMVLRPTVNEIVPHSLSHLSAKTILKTDWKYLIKYAVISLIVFNGATWFSYTMLSDTPIEIVDGPTAMLNNLGAFVFGIFTVFVATCMIPTGKIIKLLPEDKSFSCDIIHNIDE